jgi:hypothetical protein
MRPSQLMAELFLSRKKPPTYGGLSALELGGELGEVILAEGVRLLEDVHHLGIRGKIGHVKHVSERRDHLHLVQNLQVKEYFKLGGK